MLKNTFKVAIQYLFIVFIIYNTVSYFKPNFKLKIDQKCVLFKTWMEVDKKLVKIFEKRSDNPDTQKKSIYYLDLC